MYHANKDPYSQFIFTKGGFIRRFTIVLKTRFATVFKHFKNYNKTNALQYIVALYHIFKFSLRILSTLGYAFVTMLESRLKILKFKL